MTENQPITVTDNVYLTKPIVKVWRGLIERAKSAKKRFNDRAAQIMAFYSGGPTSMWEPTFMNQFLGAPGSITAPRFKVQLNLAFEQVAILGPMLFWEMADRKVSPHRSLQLDPQMLAGGNPQMIQMFEQMSQQQAVDDARNEIRSKTLQHALNYFQREQPGTLSKHSDLGVFEALTTGAGFLKTEPYQFPFSDRTLVRSVFEPVANVLVDANCIDPLWESAGCVMIEHNTPVMEIERIFKLPPGSMQQYATGCSENSAFETATPRPDGRTGMKRDLVKWYECFSRAGFGNALTGREEGLQQIAPEFDAARGTVTVNGREVPDGFVYLCICPPCDYPLNLPAYAFDQEYATNDWIKEQTNWPTEYWRDNKWPVEMLSLYPHSGTSAWPEAPLAPCLGELTCLNILMSCYVAETWNRRQEIIGVDKGALAAEQISALRTSSQSPLYVECDPQFGKKIDDVLAFMKRPEINNDIPETIAFLREMIERRTGLSDMLYGANSGSNPRSATEFQGKMDTVNVRPENMQRKVAAWHSAVADKEVFCSYIHVSSKDIAEQLGPLGVAAWDMLVTNEAPEAILRGSKAIVEASGIRRPNKAAEREYLQGMQQYYVPVAEAYATATGNWEPMNGFIEALEVASDMELEGIKFPPPQPPDENAQAMQQAQLAELQAKAQKLSADAQKSMADAQAVGLTAQNAEQDAHLKMQVAEHGMAMKQQAAEHQLAVKTEQARLGNIGKQQDLLNKDDQHSQSMEQRMMEARQKLGLNLLQAIQQQHQGVVTHSQQLGLADDKAMQDAKRGNMITAQNMLQSAAMHDQRMQQSRQMGTVT